MRQIILLSSIFTVLLVLPSLCAGEKSNALTAKITKVEKVKLTDGQTAYKVVIDKGTRDGVSYGMRFNFSKKTINKLIVTEIGEKTSEGMIETSKAPDGLKKGMVITEHTEDE